MSRILFISPSFRRGGAEQQLAYLVKGLSEASYHVSVASFGDGPWRSELEKNGIKCFSINARSNLGRALGLLGLVSREKPDLVHCYGSSAGLLGGFAALFSGTKCISSERSDPSSRSFVRLMTEVPFNYLSQAIITNSNHSARYYARNYLAPRKSIFTVPNGVDFKEIPFRNRTFPINEDRSIRVGYIANFLPVKQHVLLPEIILELASGGRSFEFCLLGEGQEQGVLKKRLSDLNLSRSVTFHSSSVGVGGFLDSIDAYLHLSAVEGSPNAVLEALLAGLPSIVMPSKGAAEVVNSSCNGIVLSSFSPKEAASTLLALANGELNSLLSSDAGRRYVMTNYGISEMVIATRKIYDQLLPTKLCPTPVI